MIKRFKNRTRVINNDLIILVIILVAFWKFTVVEYVTDINLYDESGYLLSGVDLFKYGLPTAEEAPLYSVWYYILSLFQPDKVKLHYLNIRVLSTALPFFLYILLRRLRVPMLASVIVSGFVLLCDGNLFIEPKVSHLVIIFSLLSLIVTTYINSFANSIIVMSIGALLVSYMRPEYFLTYLLLCVLHFAFIILKIFVYSSKHYEMYSFGKQDLKYFSLFVVFVLLSSFFLIYVGVPAFKNNKGRSFGAFCQHFSLNWVDWTKSNLSPWQDCAEIIARNFGPAQSIYESAVYNPLIFGKHIRSNLKNMGKRLFALLLLPSSRFRNIEILLICTIVVLYLYTVCKRSMSKVIIKEKIRSYKIMLIYLLMYSTPGWVSVILIFPREHYLLLPTLFFIIAISTLITSESSRPVPLKYRKLLVIGGIIIILVPTAEIIQAISHRDFPHKENLKTINFLKSLRISEQVNLLAAEGQYNIFIGDNYHRIAEYHKHISFKEFMEEKKIDMIVLSKKLEEDARFRDDEEWKSFIINYDNFGYTKIKIEGTNRELLAKKVLLITDSK